VRDGSKIREIPGGNGSVVPNQRFFLLFFLSACEGVPPSACSSGSDRWVHGNRSN